MTSSRRARLLLVALGVVALALDLVTKQWALSALGDGLNHPLLGDWLSLRLLRNPGASLSLGSGITWVFTVLAVAFLGAVVVASRRLDSLAWAVCLGLLAGGAAGNLVDRLVREPYWGRGHVIDFIGYGDWFVGNVADIFIVVGVALALLLALRAVPFGPGPALTPGPDPAHPDSGS